MARAYKKNNLAKARKSRHHPNESEASDCEYTGGVKHTLSDSDESLSSSDEESLAKLEGDELKNNLRTMNGGEVDSEVEVNKQPSLYSKMATHKTPKYWTRAEKVCGLGYNKQSTCTQERKRKQQRDQKAFHGMAKTL